MLFIMYSTQFHVPVYSLVVSLFWFACLLEHVKSVHHAAAELRSASGA